LCSALRAVIVFAEKRQKQRQPSTSTELQNALVPAGFFLQPPCSTRSAARDACLLPITLRSTVSSQPFGSRLFFPAFGGNCRPSVGCSFFILPCPLRYQANIKNRAFFFSSSEKFS